MENILHNARCDFVNLSMRIAGFSCILILFLISCFLDAWTAQIPRYCEIEFGKFETHFLEMLG